MIYISFAEVNRKVLRQTFIGRKRKLSNYRSRKDIKRKKHRVINQRNTAYRQNYTKIRAASSGSEDVNITDSDVSSSKFEDLNINDEIGAEGIHIITDDMSSVTVDTNPTVEGGNFRDNSLDGLKNSDLLSKVVDVLYESGQLNDLMHLLEYLSDGSFPCTNIVFVLLMERIRFQSCPNTIGMRYCGLTKKFWTIFYRLCKGVGLKFFSGEKNWGQVVNKSTSKSKYASINSKINFAVPDEKVIRNFNRVLPKVIPPGKIESGLNLLNNKKDIIIMGDGKMVMKGLKTNFEGDMNLFGHEKEPNLNDLKNEIDNKLEYVSRCVKRFQNITVHDKYETLLDMIMMLTDVIRRVKNFHKTEEKKLNTYIKQKENGPKNVPDKAISNCKTNMYTAVLWIRKALLLNLNLSKLCSSMQENLHIFSSDNSIDMIKISNLRLLYESSYICENINALDYPHLIKRNSEHWQDLLKQSYVTDCTICHALGLKGLKLMRKHFKQFVKEENNLTITDDTQHIKGILDGITTVASVFMPAFLPTCAVMYEEGCSFIHGSQRRNMLSTTSNAVIR